MLFADALKNLASRPEVHGLPTSELLAALLNAGGLVNKAKHALVEAARAESAAQLDS